MIRKFVSVSFLAVLVLATVSRQKLQARDNPVKGIKALKKTKYEYAIKYFAYTRLQDHGLADAGLYLATTSAQLCNPSMPAESENEQHALKVIATFEGVIK